MATLRNLSRNLPVIISKIGIIGLAGEKMRNDWGAATTLKVSFTGCNKNMTISPGNNKYYMRGKIGKGGDMDEKVSMV